MRAYLVSSVARLPLPLLILNPPRSRLHPPLNRPFLNPKHFSFLSLSEVSKWTQRVAVVDNLGSRRRGSVVVVRGRLLLVLYVERSLIRLVQIQRQLNCRSLLILEIGNLVCTIRRGLHQLLQGSMQLAVECVPV